MNSRCHYVHNCWLGQFVELTNEKRPILRKGSDARSSHLLLMAALLRHFKGKAIVEIFSE